MGIKAAVVGLLLVGLWNPGSPAGFASGGCAADRRDAGCADAMEMAAVGGSGGVCWGEVETVTAGIRGVMAEGSVTFMEEELELYTVDRLGSLVEGFVCSLVRHGDIAPPVLATHVEELFPEGVSTHGERYFLQNEAKVLIASPMLELLFEQVRRAAYPERPSRFQSMFAVETLSEALKFQSQYGGNGIYKVRADVAFRGDMNLLHAGNSALVTSWFAHQYWKSDAGPNDPFWEWILKCPVEVGARVA